MAQVLQINRLREFETIACGECGIVFAVEAWLKAKWMDEKHGFYCPNGHSRRFIGESEAERIKRELGDQLVAAKRDIEWWRVTVTEKDRKLAAAKGQMTKLRKRVGNGVCPCCHRTFKQLAAHMTSQHPDFRNEEPSSDASPVEGREP